MNILASYNWIKEYVATKSSAEEFARRISLCGPSAERLYPQAEAFDKMVVGQITAIKPHPNADKLRIATVDLGERSLDLVCGGSNLEIGMKVAVALVGSKVRWHGQGDLIELQTAEIRGVKSEGMICGASEIGLADAFPHAEKEILNLSLIAAKPGTPLADALDLDDTVMDIEVTTNRPDAFSMIGLAREASAILGAKFTVKERIIPSLSKSAKEAPFKVKNSATKLCTRYQAVVMESCMVGPSPWWLKNRLRMSGIRSINNIVDITNYVMLEYGQPLHAFDYDKLTGKAIEVRLARAGEKIKALDGKEYALTDNMLVIADAAKPVAIAGVMGGEETGVTAETQTIVFEAATFDPVSVRRTARALNLHSDSSLRFEKGLPEEQTALALARVVNLCEKFACGRVASKVFDAYPKPAPKKKYSFRPERAEKLIGVPIPVKRMTDILKSLGFTLSKKGTSTYARYEVTVPYWRERDIEDERDFAEEIARIYGYHNLPSVIPSGEIPTPQPDHLLEAEDKAKDFFKAAGCTELLSYSFVSEDMLKKAGMDPAATLKVANELTADFACMRPRLIPGMLATIAENQGLFPVGQVFEVSKVYVKRDPSPEALAKGEGELPDERTNVCVAIYGKEKDDRYFREMKGLLEAYCASIGLPPEALAKGGLGKIELRRRQQSNLWHPGRSVGLFVNDQAFGGTLGEVHPAVLKRFGLDGRVVMLDFDLAMLLDHAGAVASYVPVSKFPPVLRDLAIVVADRLEYNQLEAAISQHSPLLAKIELFDVYRGKGIQGKSPSGGSPEGRKSLAFHLTFSDVERTLTAADVDGELLRIIASVKERFGAEIRS